MGRLTIFAKGNLDVHDTLHSLKMGGVLAWNGIGEVVRARRPGWSVRVRHQTLTWPEQLLDATGDVPAELSARHLDLGAFSAASQFSTALFDADCDAVVLSIQPLAMMSMLRHRQEGWLFCPENGRDWSQADQAWLQATFEPCEPLGPEAAMADLERIVTRRRAKSDAPILVYNLSAIMPGESVHIHAGLEDILSTRVRRFNLALIELSQRTAISVIDVDGVLARNGADRLRFDAIHLNAEGCRLVAEEVVRVLDDLGLFANDESAT